MRKCCSRTIPPVPPYNALEGGEVTVGCGDRGRGRKNKIIRQGGGEPSSSTFLRSEDEDDRGYPLLRCQGSYHSVESMLDLDFDCSKEMYMDRRSSLPVRGG